MIQIQTNVTPKKEILAQKQILMSQNRNIRKRKRKSRKERKEKKNTP